MKIAVVGANTKLGRLIVLGAEEQGIAVVSIVDNYNNLVGNGPVILKDFNKITLSDLDKFYAVIDCVSFTHIKEYSIDNLPLCNICSLLENSNIKYLAIGAKSILYTDKTKQSYVGENDDICVDSKEITDNKRQIIALKRLRTFYNVSWSCICPPLHLDERGYGSGKYMFCDDVIPISLSGKSRIAIKDFATSIIEYLKLGLKVQKIVSVRES